MNTPRVPMLALSAAMLAGLSVAAPPASAADGLAMPSPSTRAQPFSAAPAAAVGKPPAADVSPKTQAAKSGGAKTPNASSAQKSAPVAPMAARVVAVPALPPEKPEISAKEKEKGVAAKYLFASKKLPSVGKPRAIGYYPRGCLQGAVELPINGPTWQVMRLSRNRNWGHPELVKFLERFARLAAKAAGWHGILVGDLGQPRGGPLPFGHKSHQVGLDVDIWYSPMPDRILTKDEREKISAINLVASDWKHLNPKTWMPAEADFIRTAAEQPEVERVLVNAVIKKELCRLEGKNHWSWLAKVRPWYGHHDHIHVRLKCPADSPHCRHQPPVPGGDGCGDKELAYWFSDKVLHPKPSKGPAKPGKQIMLADLPAACKQVLDAPPKNTDLAGDRR
jgi:penicillin-insensitive murein DD-endopeptidase